MGYKPIAKREDSRIAINLIDTGATMGTPSGPRTGFPNELPWLTFTGGGKNVAPVAAVVSLDWSEQMDGTKQPITPARAVWVPWPVAVASTPITYYSLYEQVRNLHWPTVDGGPEGESNFRIGLATPAPDWDRVAEDIRGFGTAFVADIAASVAAGERVTIPLDDNAPMSLDERVRFLDAVMALLPFGARNCLTVATWASYQVQHLAHLTFSDGVQPNQLEASLRERRLHLPEPLPRTGDTYLGELSKLLDDGHPLDTVVRRLSRSCGPRQRVADIGAEVLVGMRLPKVVYEELLRGESSVARVQAALREIRVNVAFFPPEYLDRYVRYLASAAGGSAKRDAKRARAALIRHWDNGFGAILGDRCRDESPVGSDGSVIWLDVAVAAQRRVEGAVLSYLTVALDDPPVPPTAPAFGPLLNMVLHYLSTTPSMDPDAYRCLMRQPHVLAGALQTIMVPATGRFGTRLSRFRPGHAQVEVANRAVNVLYKQAAADPGSQWLRPILYTASGQLDRILVHDMRALFGIGADVRSCFVRVLFSMAHHACAVDAISPMLEHLIAVEDSGENRTAVGELVTQIRALLDEHAVPLPDATRARIDVWSLLVGPPRHDDLAGWPSLAYNDAFALATRSLNEHWTARIAENMAGYLVAERCSPWHLAARIRDLVRPHYLGNLAGAVKSMQPERVRELEQTLPPDWWRVLADSPELDWYRSLLDLEHLVGRRAEVSAVFGAARRAFDNAAAVPEVLTAFTDYLATSDATAADELLNLLFDDGAAGSPVADDMAARVLTALVTGACGAAAETGFRRRVRARHGWYTALAQRCSDAERLAGREVLS